MLNYMIYILAFAVGSILGLLYSYKKHGEPYVAVTSFNLISAAMAIVGWCLAFNAGNVVLSAVGFFLGGLVMGERPGYGRRETALGLILAIGLYLLFKINSMM